MGTDPQFAPPDGAPLDFTRSDVHIWTLSIRHTYASEPHAGTLYVFLMLKLTYYISVVVTLSSWFEVWDVPKSTKSTIRGACVVTNLTPTVVRLTWL